MAWVLQIPTGPRDEDLRRLRYDTSDEAEAERAHWAATYTAECDEAWGRRFQELRPGGEPYFVTRARIWEEP